jgi:hypothetical protein
VLRNDLLLLNDADVIRLPSSQWPIPRAAVRYALDHGKPHFATNSAVTMALVRVRARLDDSTPSRGADFDSSLSAGSAGLFRDFDTLGREDAELSGRATYSTGERAEFSLNVAAVANPDDGDEVRFDGSHATVQLGNWLLSANALDRWWGPGHEGSLILSNNARPMPTIMVDRAAAMSFESKWLSWLGPWRMNFGISQMEQEREDIDAPLFMAWRIEIMPFKDIELGFSRTAQFCGEGLPCNLQSFWDMLVGNDNPGIDVAPEDEPGNQMAGFDFRWNSPIGNWPYALYSQYIGEDQASYLPHKYLLQVGVEGWKPTADGGLMQWFAEYNSTTCSAHTQSGPFYNCAYNQGLFNVEGYRYKGRVIGFTSDRDADNYAIGVNYTAVGGQYWSATARSSRLNRDDVDDVRNTVASVPTEYNALEFGWRGPLFGIRLEMDLGVQSVQPVQGGERDVQAFGFVRWNHSFAP